MEDISHGISGQEIFMGKIYFMYIFGKNLVHSMKYILLHSKPVMGLLAIVPI